MAKTKPTKADYEEAGRRLAYSLVIHLRVPYRVESWLNHIVEHRPDEADRLQRELLRAAWAELRSSRKATGECIDCGYPGEHYPLCPQYEGPDQ